MGVPRDPVVRQRSLINGPFDRDSERITQDDRAKGSSSGPWSSVFSLMLVAAGSEGRLRSDEKPRWKLPACAPRWIQELCVNQRDSTYDGVFSPEGVEPVACTAHTSRKLFEEEHPLPERVGEIHSLIGEFYEIEREPPANQLAGAERPQLGFRAFSPTNGTPRRSLASQTRRAPRVSPLDVVSRHATVTAVSPMETMV